MAKDSIDLDAIIQQLLSGELHESVIVHSSLCLFQNAITGAIGSSSVVLRVAGSVCCSTPNTDRSRAHTHSPLSRGVYCNMPYSVRDISDFMYPCLLLPPVILKFVAPRVSRSAYQLLRLLRCVRRLEKLCSVSPFFWSSKHLFVFVVSAGVLYSRACTTIKGHR